MCTVGSYDGVHIGHRRLIDECRSRAHQIGGESVLLTFEPHPRVVLGRAEGLKLLTTVDEKIELLAECGVDNLIVIPFDVPFSRLKYNDFVERYLLDRVSMRSMVVGYNHLFGHKNEGDYNHLRLLSDQRGFDVVEMAELRNDERKVSSTVIRRLIESGAVEEANQHLGRPYLIIYGGVGGEPLKLFPPDGRYWAKVDGVECVVEVVNQNSLVRLSGVEVEMGCRVEILKSIENVDM
ncbi:MAG: FAD synthetase family protein [Rikenellaceae bacterium]